MQKWGAKAVFFRAHSTKAPHFELFRHHIKQLHASPQNRLREREREWEDTTIQLSKATAGGEVRAPTQENEITINRGSYSDAISQDIGAFPAILDSGRDEKIAL